MEGPLGNYRALVDGFLKHGYRPIFFDELSGLSAQLIIRHDVDFDCQLAHDLSLIEDGMGVKSTWFFLPRSVSYNPFSKDDADAIRSIHARGHRIGIHFDPTRHEDTLKGFAEEQRMFESFFNMPVRITSIHRPNDFLKNCKEPLCGVEHTYQDKYFKDIKYISDSQGLFRYGHPFETGAFKAKTPIHLLIHPLWWMFPDAADNVALLDRFLEYRVKKFQRHMADNCTPYMKRIGL